METFRSGPYGIERRGEFTYVIPRQGRMLTDGVIYSDAGLFEASLKDGCPVQVANVAHLPGIVGPSIAMPDIHSGYGFPIGGVAAFDADEGVVSPGGVGYDINCGVRVLTSRISREELAGREDDLLESLYRAVPAGVGSKRSDLGIDRPLFEACMLSGAAAAVDAGFGGSEDLGHIEGGGLVAGADPGAVSSKAFQRGSVQLGTLGSGNHFVEVGYVDKILDEAAAAAFGIILSQVTVTVHTGSRGFGHQICEDAVRSLRNAPEFKALDVPDRQLCCAPIQSPRGKAYLAAMAAAANFAFANRQIITQMVREGFNRALRGGGRDRTLDLLYDVAHNIAKFEEHKVEGRTRRVLVHRKGATRAFPPGHPELTVEAFRKHGQPVIVPGDMGRYSYILAGIAEGGAGAFLSSAHGAGRTMSRSKAKATETAGRVLKDLKKAGVKVRAVSKSTVVEECPAAYKDVAHVVRVLEKARLARPIARLKPLLVVKG
jgi:tRNA-splicing ligase RtcB